MSKTLERDFLLDSNGDLDLSNLDIKLTSDEQTVAQRIRRRLLTFREEWFLDETLGIPYYTEILGIKNPLDAIRAIFISEINKVPGVKEILDFELSLDNETRIANIACSIITTTNANISVTIN